MAKDLKKINASPNVFVFADKIRNIYGTPLEIYNKLLHDNVTKPYQHGSEDTIKEIDRGLKEISTKLGIGDPKYRLINPAKSECGKICKTTLDKINQDLRPILKLNQWRNAIRK